MKGRLRALDGLRGLLALYILAGHTLPFLCLPPRLGWVGGVVSHGRGAVDLFFILSGMVILRALDDGAMSRATAGRFLAARAGRLLPVYLLALGIAAAVLCLGDPFAAMGWLPPGGAAHDIAEAGWPQPWLAHLVAHATLTQGLLPPALLPDAEFSILGPAWSLSTEWQFYLLIAAGMIVAAGSRPRDTVPLLVLGLILLGLLGVSVDLLPARWQLGRAFLPREAWYFALGVASHGLLAAPGRNPTRLLYCLALIAAAALGWETRLGAVLIPVLWSLCLLCEAPVVPRLIRPLRWVLTTPPMLWFGAISYPLYLIHAPVQRLFMLALGPVAQGSWRAFSWLWGPPAILVPIVAAYALHRWVEVPCWQWSRRWAASPGRFLVLFAKNPGARGWWGGRAQTKNPGARGWWGGRAQTKKPGARGWWGGRAQTRKQALLFAKRSKNSHQPIDGG